MAEDLVTIFLIGMMGVGVGGIITFVVQRNLQKRAWGKERAEAIYAPLLDQLYEVEADLNKLERKFLYSEWEGLRKKHLLHWIKPDLKEKLWNFFVVKLHNFNIGVTESIKRIKEPLKEEILGKIKEEKIDQLKRTQPLVNEYFWNQLAKIVLQRDEIGFLGAMDNYPKIRYYYDELEKDFKTKEVPFDDFVKSFASKFRDDPLLKEVKEEQEKLLGETQDLQRKVKKEMGIRIKIRVEIIG